MMRELSMVIEHYYHFFFFKTYLMIINSFQALSLNKSENHYHLILCLIIFISISVDYQILPSEVTYDLSAGGRNTSFDASFDDFVYIGHRGDGSTSERSVPYLENTISSFVKAQNHVSNLKNT